MILDGMEIGCLLLRYSQNLAGLVGAGWLMPIKSVLRFGKVVTAQRWKKSGR